MALKGNERMVGVLPLSLLSSDEQKEVLPMYEFAKASGTRKGKADALFGRECNPPDVLKDHSIQLGLVENSAYLEEFFGVRYPEDKKP